MEESDEMKKGMAEMKRGIEVMDRRNEGKGWIGGLKVGAEKQDEIECHEIADLAYWRRPGLVC